MTLSLLEGTFWPNSRYDIPLSVLPTMTLGDAILLPWFNYRAFLAVAAARGAGLRFDRKLAVYFFISTVISIALNSVANYMWCHDQFTGATDTVYGQLTLLGWWHYGFSILQMEIILLVSGVWCITIRKNSQPVHRLFLRAWLVLIAFSFFPLLDAASKSAFVYKGLSLRQILSLEKMAALPPVFTILVFLVLQRIRRRPYST